MKKLAFICSFVCLASIAGFAQKYHVSIEGASYQESKEGTGIASIGRSGLLSKARLIVIPLAAGTVVSYDMSYLPKKGEYGGPYENKTADMTAAEKTIVGQCKPGDRFFFEDIKVRTTDGAIVDAKPLMVQIQ